MGPEVVTTPYVYIVRASLCGAGIEPSFRQWYDDVHAPAMLTVPGIRSVTRFQELHQPLTYLALYDIDSPAVFEHDRYQEVRGWGPYEPHISWWSKSVLRREAPDAIFDLREPA